MGVMGEWEKSGGQIGLGDKGIMAVQVFSRLVVEWPLPNLPGGSGGFCFSPAHSWPREMRREAEDGGGQLSRRDITRIVLQPASVI